MKPNKKRILSLSVLLGIGVASVSGIIFSTQQNALEANAIPAPVGCQSRNISSTQTINLNDTSESNVRAYYASLSNLDESERQGQNLLKNLKPILYNMYYYTYDAVWKIYEITDRDWTLSPANETTYGTYSDGQIADYAYGRNDSKKNNPYIHALYRNHEDPDSRIRAWDAHTGNNNNALNREHVWCQSRGFKAGSGASGPAGTDVHHLIAGDCRVNTQEHNNNPYGNVDVVAQDASTIYSWLSGNINGTAKRTSPLDESSVVFEPQDCDKGDIARACFYMAARYNNLSGTDTITQFEPELTIADYATSAGKSEISSETGKPVNIAILGDLLQWHQLDPVDEYEIHRNNLIYENFQGNRNPFVDFPEWVDYIWGKPKLTDDKRTIRSWSETPTGAADPAKDVFHGYREAGDDPGEEQEEEEKEAVDIIDKAFTGNPSSYTDWSGKQGSSSDAVYAGNNSGTYGSVQLRASNNSGIVSTASGGKVTNVTVEWNENTIDGRTLSIYAKNTPYSSPADLYDNEKQGTHVGEIVYGTSSSLYIEGEYEYIGIRSKGKTLYLNSIAITYNGSEPAPEITSITATTEKSFKVGQTIKASDIVVKGNDDSIIDGFVFPDYQFTYEDAPSGGESGTKQLMVRYNELSTNVSVSVSRDNYQTANTPQSVTVDSDDWGSIKETTSDKAKDQTITQDGIDFTSTKTYRYYNYLSFKSYSSGSLYKTDSEFYNETPFSLPIKKVTWVLQGNITAQPHVEYSDDLEDWTTDNNYSMHHFKLLFGDTEFTGFVNFVSISIEFYGAGASNLANYLMLEDTANQCTTKFDVASNLFNAMTPTERSAFMTGNSYVVSVARARLEAWAENQGKAIISVDGDYEIQSNARIISPVLTQEKRSDSTMLILIVAVSFVGVGFYFFLKRKAF